MNEQTDMKFSTILPKQIISITLSLIKFFALIEDQVLPLSYWRYLRGAKVTYF